MKPTGWLDAELLAKKLHDDHKEGIIDVYADHFDLVDYKKHKGSLRKEFLTAMEAADLFYESISDQRRCYCFALHFFVLGR